MRDAVSALHPVILEQRGPGAGAGGRSAPRPEHQGGFESELRVDPGAVGATTALVFSIARELVTNATRHSGGDRVEVAVVESGEDVVVLDVDRRRARIQPGRREAALDEGHVGLASIVQRLEAIGGELEIEQLRGRHAHRASSRANPRRPREAGRPVSARGGTRTRNALSSRSF